MSEERITKKSGQEAGRIENGELRIENKREKGQSLQTSAGKDQKVKVISEERKAKTKKAEQSGTPVISERRQKQKDRKLLPSRLSNAASLFLEPSLSNIITHNDFQKQN